MGRLCLNLALSGVGIGNDPAMVAQVKLTYKRIMLKGYFDHAMCVLLGTAGLIGGEENAYNATLVSYMVVQGYLSFSFLLMNLQWSIISRTVNAAFHGQTKKDTLKVQKKVRPSEPLPMPTSFS